MTAVYQEGALSVSKQVYEAYVLTLPVCPQLYTLDLASDKINWLDVRVMIRGIIKD